MDSETDPGGFLRRGEFVFVCLCVCLCVYLGVCLLEGDFVDVLSVPGACVCVYMENKWRKEDTLSVVGHGSVCVCVCVCVYIMPYHLVPSQPRAKEGPPARVWSEEAR
jgi:hypothetical protein